MKFLNRRNFLFSSAAILGAGGVPTVSASEPQKIKILGISGSPRRDKTTVQTLQVALDAARNAAPAQIETELVYLVDYDMFGSERPFGDACVTGRGNFAELAAKAGDPAVRGILVGSPVHNGMISVLTAAFFDQIDHTFLQGKIGAALAVGGARNGGQEVVVQCINNYLLHEGVILSGTGMPGRTGAMLWNQNDSIEIDEFGKGLAESVGYRVAKLACVVPPEVFG